MPELPDIEVYLSALRERIVGKSLVGLRIANPFLLRSVQPKTSALIGRDVISLHRQGKRIVFGFTGDHWAVLHLMIAGRLHWQEPASKLPAKRGLAAFDFTEGSLILTEAGSKKRASLHLLSSAASLTDHEPGGLEILDCDLDTFEAAITASNHTLKRSLTDPRTFSGIGNAYSDEILHQAGLSPVTMTKKLAPGDIARLFEACQKILANWTQNLERERAGAFPEKVTAFRKGMAVHGRYGKACPRCQTTVQRIRYASNETNYCPSCQTGGQLLADRSLSRLLKKDWPATVEELETLKQTPPPRTGRGTPGNR